MLLPVQLMLIAMVLFKLLLADAPRFDHDPRDW